MKRAEGCKNLHIAKLTLTDGTPSYATPKRLRGLESISSTESYAEATAYSDNQMDTNKKKPSFVDLAITLGEFTPELDAEISGKQVLQGKTVTSSNDTQPSFAVLYEQTNSDGTSTFFAYYNVTLAKEGRENTTVGESITYDSVNLTGKAIPLPSGVLDMSFDSDSEGLGATDVANFFKQVLLPTVTEAKASAEKVAQVEPKVDMKKENK